MTGTLHLLLRINKEGIQGKHALAKFPCTIGRHTDNEIVVNDTRISRHHARLEKQNGSILITDLESTHRTFINSKEVEQAVLNHGDHISLGKKINFIYLDREDTTPVQEYLESVIRLEGDLEESAYSTHVARQMDSLMDSLKAKNMDTMVLKRINEEVQRSVTELKCLYEIGQAINSELNLDKVLELIINHVIRATGAERGFIMLGDKDGTLVPTVAKDMEENLDEVERYQFSTTIARKAVDTKETIVSKDTSTDPSITTQSVVDYNIRSAICAPLISRGKAIGVLYVDAKESMKEFGDKDKDFFTALANQSAIAIENAQLLASLRGALTQRDRKIKELSALFSISRSLMNVNDLESVLATILDTSIETIGSARGSIMLYAEGEDHLVTQVIRGEFKSEVKDRIKIRKGEGIAGLVVETGQGIICNDGFSDPRFKKLSDRESDVKQILCVPLSGTKEIIGVINLVNKRDGQQYSQDDLQLLTSIASQAGVTIENSRLYDLAVYDGLTRVHIRRYFDAWIAKEFERAKRYGSDLSLIIVDIDHFKHVNDTYGHQAGDEVLVELAQIFKQSIRTVDIVARYGGEEFVICLPETNLDGAALFANRLRERVEAKTIEYQNYIIDPTISIGVANFRQGFPSSSKQLIEQADKVLYKAKATGRNRVCTFRPEDEGCDV